MSNIPAYQYPCIAPDAASSNSVYVLGVPSTAEGRLEAYRVNLSNVNAPNAVFVSNYTESTWQSAAPKLCNNFPSDPANSPIMVQQFGTRSFMTQMHPNGTFEWSANFEGIAFVSPKLYSFTGANGNYNWYTALTNSTNLTSGSRWVGLRLNDTRIVYSYRDYFLGQYPSPTPLLSVGTYTSSARPPVVGYHCVFESDGKSGTIFTTSSSGSDIGLVDRIQTLSNPQPIDMGGVVLTQDAYPVSQGSVGYVIDKAASDGSTLIYKISPGSGSFKLTPVTPANVPPFWPNRAVTSIGSQLIFFGGLQNGTPTTAFHIYDSLTNQWSGPNLVPYKPPSGGTGGNGGNGGNGANGGGGNGGNSGSGGNTGAIIGGVVGGLVLLALIGFFAYRHFNNKKKVTDPTASTTAPTTAPVPATNTTGQVEYQAQYVDGTKVPPNHMAHPPYSGVPSSQTMYPPPVQYPGINVANSPPPNTYSQYGMTAISSPPKPGYDEQPVIFQPQSYQTQQPTHSYQPPILTSIDQSSPQIFQPSVAASSTAASPVPTTTAYSPVPTTTSYSPANYSTSTTQHSHVVHVPASSAGSPQYIQPPDHGYAP